MNLTVISLLRRVLPLKGFRYQSAQWVKGVGPERKGIVEVKLAARARAAACCSQMRAASSGL